MYVGGDRYNVAGRSRGRGTDETDMSGDDTARNRAIVVLD